LLEGDRRRAEQAEQALTRERDRAQTFLDVAGVMLVVIEADQTVSLINRKGCEVLECEEKEIIGANWFNTFVPERYRERVKGVFARLLAGEIEPMEYFENVVVTRTGQEKIIAWHNTAFRDQAGKIIRSLSSGEDITERKTAEQALRESEERYRTAIESSNDGVVITREGRHLYVNQRFLDMFGYEGPKEVLGTSLADARHMHPDDRERMVEIARRRQAGGATPSRYEHRAVHKDGRVLHVEASSTRIVYQGEPAFLSYLRDITERKLAERYQSLSAEILGILNEPLGLPDAINRILAAIKRGAGFDAVGIRLRDGDDFPYFAQSGFSHDFLLTENTLIARDENGGPCRDEKGNIRLECTCGLVLTGQIDAAYPLFTKGGSCWTNNAPPLPGLLTYQDPRLHLRNSCIQQGHCSVALIPIHANRDIVGLLQLNDRKKDCFTLEMIQFFEGISASIGVALMRKQQEDALRESEERHRTILQTAMDGFWMADLQGRLLEVNETYCRMSGYSAQELLAMRILDFKFAETEEENVARIRKIMAQGEDRFESRHRRKDGSFFDVEVSVQYRPAGGGRLVAFLQDITERKKAEEKIRVSLKEKEVLLKEIHHRVKNNLQIVSSLLFLQATRTEHPGAVSALQESRGRVKSMALIHERLYASPDLASIDMGEYAGNLVSDLQHSYRTEGGLVRFTLDLEDIPLGITEAIPCGLIINELVCNALKHAFPKGKGGEITIRLQRKTGNRTTLIVSDNGIGFPEHMDFRKSPSLGLTLVNSLVDQLDGVIRLDKRGGTVFTIMFG
jgi:PAS domain S-box-containing protein